MLTLSSCTWSCLTSSRVSGSGRLRGGVTGDDNPLPIINLFRSGTSDGLSKLTMSCMVLRRCIWKCLVTNEGVRALGSLLLNFWCGDFFFTNAPLTVVDIVAVRASLPVFCVGVFGECSASSMGFATCSKSDSGLDFLKTQITGF